MSINMRQLPEAGEDFKIEALGSGTYVARIVGILDIGNQWNTNMNTGEKEIKHRVMFIYELPQNTIATENGPMPRWLIKEYNVPQTNDDRASLNQIFKNLAKPEDNAITDLIGYPCMVNTGLSSGNKDKVIGVVGVPAGMEDSVPPLANPPFTITSEQWDDLDAMSKIKPFMQKKIQDRVQDVEVAPVQRTAQSVAPTLDENLTPKEVTPEQLGADDALKAQLLAQMTES